MKSYLLRFYLHLLRGIADERREELQIILGSISVILAHRDLQHLNLNIIINIKSPIVL